MVPRSTARRSDPLRLFRILFADRAEAALEAVQAPEGRFHHDGQPALYAGLSPEAARASITRYRRPDDPPRVLVELLWSGPSLPEITDRVTRHRWDHDRMTGRVPPTWTLADRLRAEGHAGFLYPPRLRPDLRNAVLFSWRGVLQPGAVHPCPV